MSMLSLRRIKTVAFGAVAIAVGWDLLMLFWVIWGLSPETIFEPIGHLSVQVFASSLIITMVVVTIWAQICYRYETRQDRDVFGPSPFNE